MKHVPLLFKTLLLRVPYIPFTKKPFCVCIMCVSCVLHQGQRAFSPFHIHPQTVRRHPIQCDFTDNNSNVQLKELSMYCLRVWESLRWRDTCCFYNYVLRRTRNLFIHTWQTEKDSVCVCVCVLRGPLGVRPSSHTLSHIHNFLFPTVCTSPHCHNSLLFYAACPAVRPEFNTSVGSECLRDAAVGTWPSSKKSLFFWRPLFLLSHLRRSNTFDWFSHLSNPSSCKVSV